MSNVHTQPASLLCVGYSWFPWFPAGLDRYVYELTKYLSVGEDYLELAGVGMPERSSISRLKLTNLAELESSILMRIVHIRRNFLSRKGLSPDAVNLHFALTGLPLLSILPKGIPITFTFHGPWATESQEEGGNIINIYFKYWIERYVYSRCDRFIVLSKAFGQLLHEKYCVPMEKIHVIPGGVDTQRFQITSTRQEARRQLNWPQNRMILFATRRLVRRMGLDKLLRAIAIVKDQAPEVWLAIAGKGDLREELEQQVKDLCLVDQVKFLGFLPDEHLSLAYEAADLTVVPSQSLEGFGLIILESLACGTPTICTPVGGMPEVLEPFCSQLLTSTPDENAIAECLIAFLTGKVKPPSRESCREYAVVNFDWSSIAQRVRQVLLA
jgi:glycosyltransferase involved in cell wall biosynthesis